MSVLSRSQLERQHYELLAQIAGEEPAVEKLSNIELLNESVRLLGIIAENGTGSGGGSGGGSSFAEDYGPTSGRPAAPPTGTQYFNTDSQKLEVWNGSSWATVDTVGSPFAEAYGTTAQRPTSRPVGFQYFDTDLKQLLIWDGTAWASTTSSAASPSRTLVTLTSSSLAAGASSDIEVTTLGASSLLIRLSADRASRFRLYLSAAARTADAARNPGTDPDPAVQDYIVHDTVLPHEGALSIPLNFFATMPDKSGVFYARVTNMSGSTGTVGLSYDILKLEERENL